MDSSKMGRTIMEAVEGKDKGDREWGLLNVGTLWWTNIAIENGHL